MNIACSVMDKEAWLEITEGILEKTAKNRKIISFIESYFQDKGYPITDVRPIIDGRVSLLALDEWKRMTFSVALHNALVRFGEGGLGEDAAKIAPDKLFTKPQLDAFASFHAPTRADPSRYPLTLEDVIKVNNREYTWVTTWGRFITLFFDGIIVLDPKAQREAKQNAGQAHRATIYPDKIRRIRKLMLAGAFGDQPVTVNIEENSIFDFVHKYENFGELYIESGRIIFPDGNHRALAAAEAIGINPDFANTKMTVMVKNFSDGRIKSHTAQINEQTPMEQVHAITQEASLASNMLVEDLNTESDSLLKGLIGGEDGVIGERALKGLMSNYFEFVRSDNMGTRTRYAKLRRQTIAMFNELIRLGVISPDEKLSNPRGLLFCALLSRMEKHDEEAAIIAAMARNVDFAAVDAMSFTNTRLGARSRQKKAIEEIVMAAAQALNEESLNKGVKADAQAP